MSYHKMSDGMTSKMLNQWYVVIDMMFGIIRLRCSFSVIL